MLMAIITVSPSQISRYIKKVEQALHNNDTIYVVKNGEAIAQIIPVPKTIHSNKYQEERAKAETTYGKRFDAEKFDRDFQKRNNIQ